MQTRYQINRDCGLKIIFFCLNYLFFSLCELCALETCSRRFQPLASMQASVAKKYETIMTHTNQSYFHRGGDTPLLGATIPAHFSEIANRFPNQEAVVSVSQERRLTYQQLAKEIDRLACGLLALGFKPGDRIGIWSTNNIEWLLVQMATARIGVILVNINPAYRSNELAYALKRSNVQGLFVIPGFHKSDYVAILLEIIPDLKTSACDALSCKEFEQLRRIVIYEPSNPEQTRQPYPGFTRWQSLLEQAVSVSIEELDSISATLDHDDPINIQYTSGTTGFPKPVY